MPRGVTGMIPRSPIGSTSWKWIQFTVSLAFLVWGLYLILSVRASQHQVRVEVQLVSSLTSLEDSLIAIGRTLPASQAAVHTDSSANLFQRAVMAYRENGQNLDWNDLQTRGITEHLTRADAGVAELERQYARLASSGQAPIDYGAAVNAFLGTVLNSSAELRQAIRMIRVRLADLSQILSAKWWHLYALVISCWLLMCLVYALSYFHHREQKARQAAEAAARRKEELLQLFVKHTPAAIAMLDTEMKYLLVSDRWIEAYALDTRDLAGRSHYDVFPEIRSMPHWLEIHKRCLAGSHEECEEDRFPRADGSIDWVKWEIHPWYNAMMEVGGIIMFTEVVTAKKKAEMALRSEEARFRTLTMNCPVGIFQTDVHGRCLFVNEQWCAMTGLAPDEATGDGWARALHKDDHDWVIEKWQEVTKSGMPFSCEFRFVSPSGKVVWSATSAVELRDHTGNLMGFLGTCTDTTVRHEHDEEMNQIRARQARINRASIMGEMASGLAHELKQPLCAISVYTDASLRLENLVAGELRDSLVKIREQAQRAGDIIDRIRNFVGHAQLTHALVDINQLISEISHSAEFANPQKGNQVKCLLAPNLPPLRLDRLQIEQVIWNLLKNAREACAENGIRGELLVQTSTERGRVQVSVCDNGPGLRDDWTAKIFEPFFTSKPEGMGMGLSICRSIIEGHGGWILAKNNPDRGATFTFTLPFVEGKVLDA